MHNLDSPTSFFDINSFERLRVTHYMNARETHDAINDTRQDYIPYHLFLMIWNRISKSDRVTYDQTDNEFVFADEVDKGSRKRKKQKKRGRARLRSSIRYFTLDKMDNEEYW